MAGCACALLLVTASTAHAQDAAPIPTPTELAALVPADAEEIRVIYHDGYDAYAADPVAVLAGVPWHWNDFVAEQMVGPPEGPYANQDPAWTLFARNVYSMAVAHPPGTLVPGHELLANCTVEQAERWDIALCGEWAGETVHGWSIDDHVSAPRAADAWRSADVYAHFEYGEQARLTVGDLPVNDLPLDAFAMTLRSDGAMRLDVATSGPDAWAARMGGFRDAFRHNLVAVAITDEGRDPTTWQPLVELVADAFWAPVTVETGIDSVSVSSDAVACSSLSRSAMLGLMVAYRFAIDSGVHVADFDTPWVAPPDMQSERCEYHAGHAQLPWAALQNLAIDGGDVFALADGIELARYAYRHVMGLLTYNIDDEALSHALEPLRAHAASDGSVGFILQASSPDVRVAAQAMRRDAGSLGEAVLPRGLALGEASAAELVCVEPGYCTTNLRLVATEPDDNAARIEAARALVPDDAIAAIVAFPDPSREDALYDVLAGWFTADRTIGVAARLAPENEDRLDELLAGAEDIVAVLRAAAVAAPDGEPVRDLVEAIRIEVREDHVVTGWLDLPSNAAPEFFLLNYVMRQPTPAVE